MLISVFGCVSYKTVAWYVL